MGGNPVCGVSCVTPVLWRVLDNACCEWLCQVMKRSGAATWRGLLFCGGFISPSVLLGRFLLSVLLVRVLYSTSAGFSCTFLVAGVYFWCTSPESDFPTDGGYLLVCFACEVVCSTSGGLSCKFHMAGVCLCFQELARTQASCLCLWGGLLDIC